MLKLTTLLLLITIPTMMFADDGGHKVRYDGGSLPGLKSGNEVKLFIDPTQLRLVKDKKDVGIIPANTVTEVSYGQDVHRRVGAAIGIGVFTLGIGALMALTKSKKHFVGITWDDAGKKGGFAIQVDKDEYRGVLTGIEGVTGKKAIDSDAMNVKN